MCSTEPVDTDDDWLLTGEDLSRPSAQLDFNVDLVDFSIFAASSFGLVVSAPIALHVCASKASGLLLASSCMQSRKEKEKNHKYVLPY